MGLITGIRVESQSIMTTVEGKLQQVKSLLSSSSVNELRVIDIELMSKIRSSVVLKSKDLNEQRNCTGIFCQIHFSQVK